MEPAAMALAWVMTRPGVTAPLIGPRTEDHLDRALAATELQIGDDVTARLDAIVPPGTSVTNFFNNPGCGGTVPSSMA